MAVKDVLFIYDSAVMSWISNYLVHDTDVKVVFATPDRPFGELQNGWADARLIMMQGGIVVAVTRVIMQYDPSRHEGVPWVFKLKATDNFYVTSKAPKPYVLGYQIDMRSRLRSTANEWIQNFYFDFDPYHTFLLDFSLPWGKKSVLGTAPGGVIDNSDLETNEEERFIRLTFTVNLEANLFPAVDQLQDFPNAFGQLGVVPNIEDIAITLASSPTLSSSDPANQLDSVIESKATIVASVVSTPYEKT